MYVLILQVATEAYSPNSVFDLQMSGCTDILLAMF